MNENITVTPEEKALAVSMSEETLQASQSINNTLTIAGVRPHFQAHYANAQTNVIGIMSLVRDILTEHSAVFPRGIEDIPELRKIAVAGAMFTGDILREVEKRFTAGSTRYPLQSVKNCLSTYGKADGTIGKIQLTNHEDKPRPVYKPRCKWYVVQKKGN